MWKKFVSWLKLVSGKIWSGIKAIGHQIRALVTDNDWDLDPQKLVGFVVAASGALIFVVVAIRYAAGSEIDATAAGIGLGAIATGGAMLGWRNHTDNATAPDSGA